MRIPSLYCIAILCFAVPVAAQFQSPLSDRVVAYRIDVRLDEKAKTLEGEEHLTWRNPSTEPVGDLQFHLYLNAFKNTHSTAMKESGGRFVRDDGSKTGGWGYIDVTSIRLQGGAEVRPLADFISPDDSNAADQTVLRVPLPSPVGPGQSIGMDIRFTARLPRLSRRTGYSEDFFMIAQWFPKLGVFEPKGMRYAARGAWNCHQFHASTEFYADFGTYEVNMTVPHGFTVGATGVRVRETENSNGTATLTYRAEDVHDFAWVASPRLEERNDIWRDLRIRLLMPPERLFQSHRHVQCVKAALEYMDAHVGRYPYPELTIVDPPSYAAAAGGMEYPTLFTTVSSVLIPEQVRFPEVATVHEFIHQYFYGMVASNEFEEAWMDEGFTTYYETRVMDAFYGPRTSAVHLFGFQLGDFEFERIRYATMPNPRMAPATTFAWELPPGGEALTYCKTATILATLKGLIGEETMDSVMTAYFRRWSFRHPCGRDFIAVVNDIVPKTQGEKYGKDWNWFFDQVLYGTGVCDYELSSIRIFPVEDDRGYVESDSGTVLRDVRGEVHGARRSEVTVSRLGEVQLPVEVLVRFSDGSDVLEQWDGKARVKVFRYTGTSTVVWASVDPGKKIPLDINVTNNVKSFEPSTGTLWKYFCKVLFWLQNIFQGAATII